MSKILPGLVAAVTVIALQFSTSLYYTYRFNKEFTYTCGSQNGYTGNTTERIECVYKELGHLDTFAKLVLMRPAYNMWSGVYFKY